MAGMQIILKNIWLVLVMQLLAACAGNTVVPTATPSTLPTRAALVPTLAPTPTAAPTPSGVATSPPLATALPPAALPAALAYSYPIGRPGRPLGDRFFIRHGYTTENTWYNPGYWHTGEDWYAQDGDTAGAHVYAIADGQVVYAGANYPGRVVIVKHADTLFSMYGHLDPDLGVRVDQRLTRGDLIGRVLRRGDTTPNHLHFEIRTFLTAPAVNGAAPRYPFRCGPNCPPGPGYWPLDAPDLPSELGWRNPVHVLARRMAGTGGLGEVVVAAKPISSSATLWSAAPNDAGRATSGELALHAGERYALLDLYAGAEDTRETSARAYQLWYRIALPDGGSGWVQAAVASNADTGSDGRPSSLSFNFFPAVVAFDGVGFFSRGGQENRTPMINATIAFLPQILLAKRLIECHVSNCYPLVPNCATPLPPLRIYSCAKH